MSTRFCRNGVASEFTEEGMGYCPSKCPFNGSKCYGKLHVAKREETFEVVEKCSTDQQCEIKNVKVDCYDSCSFEDQNAEETC